MNDDNLMNIARGSITLLPGRRFGARFMWGEHTKGVTLRLGTRDRWLGVLWLCHGSKLIFKGSVYL